MFTFIFYFTLFAFVLSLLLFVFTPVIELAATWFILALVLAFVGIFSKLLTIEEMLKAMMNKKEDNEKENNEKA